MMSCSLVLPVSIAAVFACVAIDSGVAIALPVDGATLGLMEKGAYAGADFHLDRRDLLEAGVFFIDNKIANLDVGLNKSLPVSLRGGGARIAYSRFLAGSTKTSGLYVQLGLVLANLSASSAVDADSINYRVDSGTVVTCSTCGRVKVATTTSTYRLSPSLGLGVQAAVGRHALLRALLGVQYYAVPKISIEESGALPLFARNEIDVAIRDVNARISATASIYPTASLSLTYLF